MLTNKKETRSNVMLFRHVRAVGCLLLFIALSACQVKGDQPVYPELNALVDSVRQEQVPDRRDNVYDIKVVENAGKPVIKGVTSVAEAKVALWERIRKSDPSAVDSIILLPDARVGEMRYAIINVSVGDARTGADYADEMATQLLLGMPVLLLQKSSDLWQVKTPEGYIGWVMQGSLKRMNKASFNEWLGASKVVFTEDYGFAYETPDEHKQRSSDLVFGDMLKWKGESGKFYKVAYPDGREAYVLKTQSRLYDDWQSAIQLTGESIVQTALTLKGIPYTWGGTSVKGMDCSGFTKMVFLKHGIILRRDASQQVKTGIPVDISKGYENLLPGDLMFFGKKAQDGRKERVRHVAIYMGNKTFIHAAGYVKINSLDPGSPNYDEGNTREFIRAARVVGAVGSEGIWRIDKNPLYQQQE
jgi:cell wall-associated NlpC family hydrolase